MIDFRYHLVSLISVFLALAVGIVLGAGPLRENLGTQLTDQVEQLRTDKEALRTENQRLSAQGDQLGTYITSTAPQLVAGTLKGRTVAVLTDDTSMRSVLEQVASLIKDAGGTVPVRVVLGDVLWDPAAGQTRSETVAALREKAPGLALTGDDDTARLSSGVVEVLSDGASDLPRTQRQEALQVLTSAQVITVEGTLDGPVDALLYAGAAPTALEVAREDARTAAARAQGVTATQSALLLACATGSVPAVAAGSTPGSADAAGIIRLARGDARFDPVSTVDGLQRADGPPLAVLALAQQLRGGSGDYGTGAGAQARVPELTGSAGASDGGGAG